MAILQMLGTQLQRPAFSFFFMLYILTPHLQGQDSFSTSTYKMHLQNPFGTVLWLPGDDDERTQLITALEQPIDLDDRIITKERSGALLSLGLDSVIEIAADTNIHLTEGKVTELLVLIEYGKVAVATRKRFRWLYTILAQIGAEGTFLTISVNPFDGQTTVKVFEGTASVTALAFPSRPVTVTAGFRTIVTPGRPPTDGTPIDTTDWPLFEVASPPTTLPPQEDTKTFPNPILPIPDLIRTIPKP